MKPIYLFPGSFCPPTYGHFEIAKEAASCVDKLSIVCSRNPTKNDNWFSEQEAKELWQSYPLPRNVTVVTYDEMRQRAVDHQRIVMVRGTRSQEDVSEEQRVLEYNQRSLGINKSLLIGCSGHLSDVSSSAVRAATDELDLQELARQVSPLVVSRLLERKLQAKNVFLTVGRPASGKSTLLKRLSELSLNVCWINCDSFNQLLRPIIEAEFPGQDLIELALTNEAALLEKISKPWLILLIRSLSCAPIGSHIFVEAAYGLQTNKQLFRLVGGKVIDVSCAKQHCLRRNQLRQTPELAGFIDSIPGPIEARRIAREHQLQLVSLSTDGESSANDLAERICQKLEGGLPWQNCFV